MRNIRSNFYLVIGVLLIVLVLFTTGIVANPIDAVDLDFEKDYYSAIQNEPLKVSFVISNNNEDQVQLLVYAECDDEELECEYSETFNMVGLSDITTSLIVVPIDDGSTNLKLYVKDMLTDEEKYFNIEINSDEDPEDGKFDVDLSSRSFCKGESTLEYIYIDDVYASDTYNLSLSSNVIHATLKESNPFYLNGNDNEIPFLVEVPNNTQVGSYDLILSIYNDDVYSSKLFRIGVSECNGLADPDFFVSGSITTTYALDKEDPLTLIYTMKNISNITKDFFISAEQEENILKTTLSNKQIKLLPGESKQIELTVLANEDIKAGDYIVDLSFFDEQTVKLKRLKFQVQPAYNLNTRLLQNSIALNIGHNSELQLVIENNGDISEKVNVDFVLTNDIQLNSTSNTININAHSIRVINFTVSAGANTIVKTSEIQLILTSEDSDYYEKLVTNVVAFKSKKILNISFLSYPEEVSVDLKSSKDFSLEIYNNDAENVTINRIEILGIPDGVSYTLPVNTTIVSNNSKVVTGTLIVDEIEPQEINASMVLYASNGAVLTKPLTIKVLDIQEEFEKDKIIPITGFFTVGNSILVGIIVLCVILILLYVTGTISHRNKFPKGTPHESKTRIIQAKLVSKVK